MLPAIALLTGCFVPVVADQDTDYCSFLFSSWGVPAVECEENCTHENTVLIMRRNNVETRDGRKVAGSTSGFLIEIDKTKSTPDQLSIALHELGHVLLGPTHSEDPEDLMFPVLNSAGSLKQPSVREYFLAREIWFGKYFQCKLLP